MTQDWNFDTQRSECEHVAQCIDWLVNDTLPEEQRERVQRHLGACVTCRRELEFARGLHSAVIESDPIDLSPRESLDNVMRRIDTSEASAARSGADSGLAAGLARVGAAVNRLWPASLAVRRLVLGQGMLIVLLGAAVLLQSNANGRRDRQAPLFNTATTPAALGLQPATTGVARLRVVFDPAMTQTQIIRLLRDVNGQIVHGPNAAGGWLLEIAADPVTAAEKLHAHPGVTMAVPALDGVSP